MTELGLALALMLVIEGAAYALFPDAMKRMLATVQVQPAGTIRWVGIVVAAIGVALVWLVRRA